MRREKDIHKAEGNLGVLIPGMGGAVSTTFLAGIEAVRRGGALPFGSLTQMGTIRLGKRFEYRNPKIKEFVPEKRLVWGDAMGNRVFSLEKTGSGVRFTMSEKIGGPLFPLFAGMIPSFDESFERFASDLKREAETIQKSKN